MIGSNVLKAMLGGLVATLVLAGLMVMKASMGLMPQLDVIAMLSKMMGSSLAMGWVFHFVIGTIVWGALFSWAAPLLPGASYWFKGVVFGIGAWLLMMIAVMPMAGAGLFGMGFGITAPLMTFILHVIFGLVLGSVYGAAKPDLNRRAQSPLKP